MGYSGLLATATSVRLPMGLGAHVDWVLLAGIGAMVGGGLLAQIAWGKPHQ
jgi:hypothetical protein